MRKRKPLGTRPSQRQKPNRHRLAPRISFRYKLSDLEEQRRILLYCAEQLKWDYPQLQTALKGMVKRACKHYGELGKRYG